ncbi:MAG: hypothetical protein V2G42_03685 [bacterium JZ-2024 1]
MKNGDGTGCSALTESMSAFLCARGTRETGAVCVWRTRGLIRELSAVIPPDDAGAVRKVAEAGTQSRTAPEDPLKRTPREARKGQQPAMPSGLSRIFTCGWGFISRTLTIR